MAAATGELMLEITNGTAAEYLRGSGQIPRRALPHIRELSGGVSNIVLRVDVAGGSPFVIKQCRERLRVAMDWRARLDRIWCEVATLELLDTILPAGTVPRILFVDRPNYLFAMTCAPDDAVTWKSHLMAGRVDLEIAERLGTILGTIHAEAPRSPILTARLADTSLFDELRVDPYYRMVARAHPDLAQAIDALVASMKRPERERTLVLGDFSPKNILVHSDGLILLDFECAHAGDPAFDLGFFLSHLLLKRTRAALHDPGRSSEYAELARRFWAAYLERRGLAREEQAGLVHRGCLHTAGCALARVDGKSPVEYLDALGQSSVRRFAREALSSNPATWDELCALLTDALGKELACQP
jgi:5-methylthioribose kinase